MEEGGRSSSRFIDQARLKRGLGFALLAVLLCLGEAIRMWLPVPLRSPWLTTDAIEPYQQLTEGFLAGHLYLSQQPDPRLALLSDPYDPVQNAPYRIANLSYYRGRYYLYLGIAPALTLFVPVHLLTGLYLTQRAAITVFCGLGSTAGVWLLWFVRRRLLPHCPSSVLLVSACALIFCDGYQVVLGSGSTANGVAIAGAYGFAMAGLAVCTWAMATRRRWPWLALGGLSYGLAVASRPNYLFAAAGLAFFINTRTEDQGIQSDVGLRKSKLGAIFLPFATIVAFLLAYNFVRFGRLVEFGQRYMMGAWNQTGLAALGAGSAFGNLGYYLWRPDHFTTAFPFLRSPDEFATGVMFNAPWVWLTPLAAWAWSLTPRLSAVRALGSATLTMGVANLLTLVFLPSGDSSGRLISANARYIFDFQPALVLFASIGALTVGDRLAVNRVSSRVFAIGVSLVALFSVLAALCLKFQPLPPESYRTFAGIMNQPSILYARWTGQAYGPVAFDVTFPTGHIGHSEPLVDTGRVGESDLIYVQYLGAGQARFGLARAGAAGPVGAPITIDFRVRHRIEIWMGSLLPPSGDPALAGLSEAAASILKLRVQVVLDGKKVLDDVANCYPASSHEVWFGSCPVTPGVTGSRFSGTMSPPVRLPIALPVTEIPAPEYGDLALQVRFPTNAAPTAEPLVTTGIAGAADLVYVRYPLAGQIQIGYDHWGHPGLLSPLLPIDFSASHRIVVRLASLREPTPLRRRGPPDIATLPTGGRIELDGREVLSSTETAYPSSPYDVAIGRNAIGASTCGYAFTGKIISSQRLSEPSVTARDHE